MARGGRDRRIAQELQRLLPDLLRKEVKDPRITGLVTLTGIEVSADLAHAKVFVTVLGAQDGAEESVAALNHCAAFLRSRLSQLMRLRTVPALRFVYDTSVERGMRLTRLIDSALDRDGSAEPDNPSTKP
jgi:ribosome-binding factor A